MRIKKYLIKLICTATLLSTTVIGFSKDDSEKIVDKKQPAQIKLYASEKGKKVIARLSPASHLVKIYQNGEWIKVGNTDDGSVGWVNQKQYQAAVDEFNQPDIQTVFVSKSVNDDNKPQVNIVAYKNGEQVSKKEANKIYNQFKEQQASQEEQWEAFNENMVEWQSHFFQRFANDPFFNSPMAIPSPVMVITKEKVSDEKNDEPRNNNASDGEP